MPRRRRDEHASTPTTATAAAIVASPAPDPSPAPDAPLAASRAAMLGVGALLVGLFVTAFGGDGAVAAIAGWFGDAPVLAAWLLAAWGIGPPLAPRAGDERDRTLRHLTALAIGLGAISLLVLLLGWSGLLSRPVAWLILVAGAAAAIVRLRACAAALNAWLIAPAGGAWLALLAAPAVAVAAVAARVLPGLLWGDEPHGYDVLAYHLQLPREWLELGRVVPLRHNVFSFFPLNVEMHALLAMHVRGDAHGAMYLAQTMMGAFALLVPLACYAIVRGRTDSRLAGATAAVVAFAAPWVTLLGGIAYNEGGLMLYATLSAAWALRGRWAIAGAMAGLAAGCKYTGAMSTILLVPIAALCCADATTSLRRRFVGVAIFGVAALLAFSPWLVRNAIYAGGNPVFPLALRTFGPAHFDAGQVERFEVAHAPRPDQRSIAARLTALRDQVVTDWRYGATGVVPTLFLVALVAFALRPTDRRAVAWLALIAGNVAIWLVATHLQGRFLVQTIPCVAILATIAPPRFGRWQLAAVALVATIAGIVAYREPVARLTQPNRPLPGPLNATIGLVGDLRALYDDDVQALIDDKTRDVALVGDVQPFRLPIDTHRLHYRSVFDLPSTGTFADAWIDPSLSDDAAAIVTPSEVRRLTQTYRNLPPVPPSLQTAEKPFVARVGDLRRN